ncbi:MAG: hypothetical protein ACHQYQ_08740, partial [Bacteriovoracales bacterium]
MQPLDVFFLRFFCGTSRQGKNLIGAFYQPDSVYTDPMLLETLNDRWFSDGMAELLKHGFIKDVSLYKQLVNNDD